MIDDLPEGWSAALLGDICSKPQYGWTCRAARTGTIKYVRTTDISDGHIDWTTVPYCEDIPNDLEKYRIKANDVLVSRAGSVGVSCRIADVPCDAVFASYLIRFKPRDGVAPEYIEFFLRSDTYWRAISEMSAGIALPNVNASKLAALDVPLAPVTEQRRIVTMLEQLLGKVDACQQRLTKIPVLLKRFRQSVLAAACSGRLTADWRNLHPQGMTADTLLTEIRQRRRDLWGAERGAKGLPLRHYPEPARPSDEFSFEAPDSWARCSVDELTSTITSGSRDWTQFYREDGSGTFVMAQNIRPLKFDQSYRLAVAPPKNDRDRKRSEVRKHDLLVTIVGANTGDSCRIPLELEEYYVCQSVALMRPVIPNTSRYIELFLNSPEHGLAEYNKWMYGEGRPHLSFDHLRETVVSLPPFSEQHEIVRRVETLFALVGQLEARFANAQSQMGRVIPTLLAKTFRGGLVVTEAELARQEGRDYEPASVLLERLRQRLVSDYESKTPRPTRSRASTAGKNVKRTPRSRRRAVMSR